MMFFLVVVGKGCGSDAVKHGKGCGVLPFNCWLGASCGFGNKLLAEIFKRLIDKENAFLFPYLCGGGNVSIMPFHGGQADMQVIG
jgi:hypothetical protein